MADDEKSQSYMKVALIFQVSGFLILVIGFSTPYWRTLQFEYSEKSRSEVGLLIQGFDEGLWRRCVNSICAELDLVGRDWMQAVRFFTSLGVVSSLLGVSTLIVLTLVEKLSLNRRLFLASAISSFITTGCTFLSIMIYGAIVKEGIAWSFVMVTISGAVHTVSGLLMLISILSGRKEK